jgi:hypothetical protein
MTQQGVATVFGSKEGWPNRSRHCKAKSRGLAWIVELPLEEETLYSAEWEKGVRERGENYYSSLGGCRLDTCFDHSAICLIRSSPWH